MWGVQGASEKPSVVMVVGVCGRLHVCVCVCEASSCGVGVGTLKLCVWPLSCFVAPEKRNEKEKRSDANGNTCLAFTF